MASVDFWRNRVESLKAELEFSRRRSGAGSFRDQRMKRLAELRVREVQTRLEICELQLAIARDVATEVRGA